MTPNEALKWVCENLGARKLKWIVREVSYFQKWMLKDLQTALQVVGGVQPATWRIYDIYYCIAFRLPLKRSDGIDAVDNEKETMVMTDDD